MHVQDIMTSPVRTARLTDTIAQAAQALRDLDVGALPVVAGDDTSVLVGIITDRDIAVRCAAAGHDSRECLVRDHMTGGELATALPTDEVLYAAHRMQRARVRRIPVLDADRHVVGIVTQADLARDVGPANPRLVDLVVEAVSRPNRTPARR
jgi:CBS domain-containing protein